MSTSTITPTLQLRTSSNPKRNEKTEYIESFCSNVSNQQYEQDDWRSELQKNGYVIIKNALDKEKALKYQQRAQKHLQSFNTNLSYDDKTTWKFDNLPDPSFINTFTLHCIPHEKFMWDLRLEDGIKTPFVKLWGTDELLVSFDGLNVTFPGRKDQASVTFWPHFDQSPYRNGLACVQGLVSLSNSGDKDGGLVVYKGSHDLYTEFFDTVANKEKWKTIDSVNLDKSDIDWFLSKGCEQIKINAEPGDLVLWDSRTIHYGKAPDDDSSEVRTVVYVCYTPASFATDSDLALKQEAFKKYKSTSHWPHTNIVDAFEEEFKPKGHIPTRKEPLERPEMSDELKRAAGLINY